MHFDTAIEFALCTKTFPPNRVIGIAAVVIAISVEGAHAFSAMGFFAIKILAMKLVYG